MIVAELILTEEEKEAALWQHLDDEALGKCVKKQISRITELVEEENAVRKIALILYVLLGIENARAQELQATITKWSFGEIQLGDWEITIRRITEQAENTPIE